MSRVHPTFVAARRSAQLNLGPENCFEQYATGGSCSPSGYFRHPRLQDQVREASPLNFRRNPAYSRKPFVHRPLSPTKYVAIFIGHFAYAFYKMLFVRLDPLLSRSRPVASLDPDHVPLALSRSGLEV